MLNLSTSLGPSPRAQRGLSLVELMVGMAVGLFIVAGAALMVSNQLNDNRRLLVEAQVQQDLRAAAEIMAREIRRAGSVGDDLIRQSAWFPGTAGVYRNVFAPLAIAAGTNDALTFNYARATGVQGPYGFRVVSRTVGAQTVGVLQTNLRALGIDNWQDLSDPYTIDITEMRIVDTAPAAGNGAVLACPNLCPDGTQDCWPRMFVRELDLSLTARAVRDANVVRTIALRVRPRNDFIEYRTAGSSVATAQVPPCP